MFMKNTKFCHDFKASFYNKGIYLGTYHTNEFLFITLAWKKVKNFIVRLDSNFYNDSFFLNEIKITNCLKVPSFIFNDLKIKNTYMSLETSIIISDVNTPLSRTHKKHVDEWNSERKVFEQALIQHTHVSWKHNVIK